MRSWAFSFLFLYVALSQLFLGSLAILCFRAFVRAAWLEPFTPALVRAQRLGLVLAPLFLLLAALAPLLYPWAGGTEGNAFRRAYLSETGFVLRGVACWTLWLWLSRAAVRRKAWTGGIGLVLLALTSTFASVDWVLSLEMTFSSTIFGLVFLLSSFLLAFGYAGFFAASRSRPHQRQDQGSVHLALICTWAYLAFMQFLVVWSGNLPREAEWYGIRARHGWELLPVALALGQFFLPFFLLLQSSVKRSLPLSRTLALATLVAQFLFSFWQILPVLRPQLSLSLGDVVAVLLLLLVCAYLGEERHGLRY